VRFRLGRGTAFTTVILLTNVALLAQKVDPGRRLPHPIELSGTVVDSSGSPLAQVEIGDLGHAARYESISTDERGRFRVATDAPFLVFRKAGYESSRIRSVAQPGIVITLQRAHRQLTRCATENQCSSLPGSAFCFPKITDVRTSSAYSNTDSTSRDFVLVNRAGVAVFHDCCGWYVSDGRPTRTDVWNSTEYRETVVAVGAFVIIDAQGKDPDGKRWRHLGRSGEYAAYRGIDLQGTQILDRLIDGVCAISR
jgi:hypothetical protein